MKKLITTLEVLSQQEIELIHEKTVEILETIGMKVPDEETLNRAQEIGATVDKNNQILHIPRAALEKLIEETRKIGGMDEDKFHTGHKLNGYISTQVHVFDPITGTRRLGVMDDVMKGIALAPHLNNIGKGFANVIPSDIPSGLTDVALYHTLYKYSVGGGASFMLTTESSKYIIEMAKVMGYQPSYLLETISPLGFRPDTLEMARLVADEGYGMGLAPMVMAGATGPVTAAGTLALMNAEILGSLFIIRAITRKPALYYGHGTHNMDLRTMLCSFGSAAQSFFAIASAQLGKFYGLWAGSNSALTDAISPDFQAGIEKGITGVMSALCGSVNVGCQGIAGADQGFSYEQLVLDDEWLGYMNYMMEGFEVNEETLAMDAIREVGIGGNYLVNDHTLDYMSQSRHKDRLFKREAWSAEVTNNVPNNILVRANEFVEKVTKGYKDAQPVIDQALVNELDRIFEHAKEKLG